MQNPETILTSRQISPTAMRLRVLECLRQQHTAVSLADIERAMPHTDRITVYRTLKTFEEYCLIHRIDDGTGATKYALCPEHCAPAAGHHDLHLHFHCRQCGRTSCLPSGDLPVLKLPPGYTNETQQLIVKGICAGCNP